MKELKSTVKTIKIIKRSIEAFFIVIIIFVILLSAAHVFMMFKGKTLIIQKIEELTGRKVTIGFLTVTPPLNLEIKNLNIEGLAQVEKIYLSPSFLYLITGKIGLNKIDISRPNITYEKPVVKLPEPATATEGAPAETSTGKTVPSPAPGKSANLSGLHLILRNLNIRDGKVDFIDRSVGTEGIKITAKDINIKVTTVSSLASSITNFDIKGKIPWREGEVEGSIAAEGWFNFAKRDMQANVKILDIDGVYFYPYYSQWVDLEKTRIERAKLNFTSNIQGLNNNVTAECHLELTDIVRKERAPEESADKAERITDAVIDIFRAMNQGKIVLDFTIRTKMDDPHFGFGNLKSAVEDKLTASQKDDKFGLDDVFKLPGRIIEGTLKGAGDMTKSVITGTVEAGKEIGKAVLNKK